MNITTGPYLTPLSTPRQVICIISVDSVTDAIAYAKKKPTPLASYVFSADQAVTRRWLDAIPSGSACVNDVLIQFANPDMPFGGLGASPDRPSHTALATLYGPPL